MLKLACAQQLLPPLRSAQARLAQNLGSCPAASYTCLELELIATKVLGYYLGFATARAYCL